MHFFFPDSRLALDLSTDKTLKVRRRLGPRLAERAPRSPRVLTQLRPAHLRRRRASTATLCAT